MLEKYLNKEVKIIIRYIGTAATDKDEGMITAVNDGFIELDNKRMINIDSIMKIILK